MTLVKICGIQTVEAAQWAVEAGADLIGIICVPNRKRTISHDTAIQISRLLKSTPGAPKLVGVFMNQAIDDVCRLCEEYGIDVVQLHGDENWKDYYTVLQKGIIKKMEFPRDCSLVEQMSDSSDKCLPLFDTGGGTGEKLDWDSLRKWSHGTKGGKASFWLAGGLTPDNVAEAAKIQGVLGVDVSSGVETDGKKDRFKIIEFVKNAKGRKIDTC